MPGIFLRWIITTIAIVIVPYIVTGFRISNLFAAFFVAAILGILNALIRPLLILLTLPITILTLGIFILIINTLMLELAAAISPGVSVDSFGSAFFASIIISIVSWILNNFVAGGGGERFTIVTHTRHDALDMRKDSRGKWE
jgi:putative membrane protein